MLARRPRSERRASIDGGRVVAAAVVVEHGVYHRPQRRRRWGSGVRPGGRSGGCGEREVRGGGGGGVLWCGVLRGVGRGMTAAFSRR